LFGSQQSHPFQSSLDGSNGSIVLRRYELYRLSSGELAPEHAELISGQAVHVWCPCVSHTGTIHQLRGDGQRLSEFKEKG
jgi:hypothetical protein